MTISLCTNPRLVVGDRYSTPECDAVPDLLRGVLRAGVVPRCVGVDVPVNLD